MNIRTLIDQIDQIEESKKHYIQAKLPYDRTDLVPVMSKDTLDYHYGKLYKGYVDRANEGKGCLLYTSPSPRDQRGSGMPACG